MILFRNLIENGIKYNDSENPTVKLSCKKDENFFSIFFEDNGLGIPEAYEGKVFKMFSRLHNQEEYEGSGLGLSTCKKIMVQLDGQINLVRNTGEGSVFEVKFPATLICG